MNLSKICAVVVTYNPDIKNLLDLLRNISEEVDNIVVVDNASSNITEFEPLIAKKIELIKLDQNYGIARAHNEGVLAAKKHESDFLILFDQDSQIEKRFIQSLLDDFIVAEEHYNLPLAVLGPKLYNVESDFIYKSNGFINGRLQIILDREKLMIEPIMVISSGSLYKIEVFEKIGLFKEELFIDSVDTEWCLRAKHLGFMIIQSNLSQMNHKIGNQVFKFCGKTLHIHSPFRRYYIIRNLITLLKYNYVNKVYFSRILFDQLILQILLIFFTAEKIGNFRALWWGIYDGCLGRLNKSEKF